MRMLPIEKLQPKMLVGRNIYDSRGNVLLRENVRLTRKNILGLQRLDIPFVYVKDGLGDDIEIDDIVREESRIAAIGATRNFFEKAKVGGDFSMRDIQSTMDNLIEELLANTNHMINLVDIRSKSDYLYSHSVNVAVLSGIIGIGLGYSKQKLRDLVLGALFHDIGKIKEDGEEENRPWDHTKKGFDLLRENKEISLLSAHVAYQHHEWINGMGYPQGLKGYDIHEFARIVSIADIYDGLTAGGEDGKNHSIHEAIEFIISRCGSRFDYDLVRLFLDSIALYPVGSKVKLNTGEDGIIIKSRKGIPTRPVVRVKTNAFGVKHSYFYEIDLARRENYFIVSSG